MVHFPEPCPKFCYLFLYRQLPAGEGLPGRLLWCFQSGGRWEELKRYHFFPTALGFAFPLGASSRGSERPKTFTSARIIGERGPLTGHYKRTYVVNMKSGPVFIFGGRLEKRLSPFQILMFHSYICLVARWTEVSSCSSFRSSELPHTCIRTVC